MSQPRKPPVRLQLEQLEERELPSAASPVENLASGAVWPAAWTQWSSGANTFTVSAAGAPSDGPSLTTSASSNVTGRLWDTATVLGDGRVQASIYADSLVPVQVFARGRNLDSATPTYYAAGATRGLQIDLVRVVNGLSTPLGTLKSNSYVSGQWVQVSLSFSGAQLSVQVQRGDTGQYLDGQGNWVTAPVSALQTKDAAIVGDGLAGINRQARYAGAVSVDDFAATAASGPIVSENFNTTSIGAVAAGWSSWSSTTFAGFGVAAAPAVDGRGLASSGSSVQVSRTWDNDTLPADVQATASIYVDSLIPAQILVRGAHLDGTAPTYYAVSVSRGLSVSVIRDLDGVSAPLATIQSNTYTSGVWVRASITVQGNHLQVRVQRTDTGLWLNSDGDWQADPAAALNAIDTSISGAGQVGLARPASYAGQISFDNFEAQPGTDDITAPTLQFSMPNQNPSGVVAIPVTVNDPSGIAKVQYFVDGLLVAVNTTGPYAWNLDTRNFSNGTHVLTVRAYDTVGNVAESALQANFANPTSFTLPDIPQHYSHIRIAELAYNGNPMGATEKALLQSSVDLVVPNTSYLGTIDQISPNTPQLIYSNVSNLYLDLLADWLNYADSHGLSRELAFYHVAQPTSFSGASASAQPVNWFWNTQLGPASGTAGYKSLTSQARDSVAGDVAFGDAGQALYLGYTELFREINVTLSSGKKSGWSSVLEYPTAVDANGNPTAWKTLNVNTDTTSGLSQSGQITFDPPKDWVTAVEPGSTARLYYVRVRTVTGTAAQAPLAKSILGRDYVNAKGGTTGVIPVFDFAADTNHDGYLSDAEYAKRTPGEDARFVYESRLFYPYYGQMRFATNPSSQAVQNWATDYQARLLGANPLADGVFMDNSSGKNPTDGFALVESAATYTSDYSALLLAISRAIAPKWVMANTSNGGSETDQVVRQVPATMEEFAIRALASNWQQFSELANTVAERQSASDPAGYLVLDSLSTGGAPTDPRTQLATLSSYYLLGNPKTTFLMLWGGEEPASTWSRHWFGAVAYDVGQPQGGYAIFATGKDPSNSALTYNIYERQYTNALVLYKPLSYTTGKGSGATGDSTATTHQLNGTYRLLNADGTLGTPVTSVTLRNGEGAILIKA